MIKIFNILKKVITYAFIVITVISAIIILHEWDETTQAKKVFLQDQLKYNKEHNITVDMTNF